MTVNSQRKGKTAERDVANWLKVNGYPEASRAVKTGTRFVHDGGDLIVDCREFRMVIEVKNHAKELTPRQVSDFSTKLNEQVLVSSGNFGFLIEKRNRVADPGQWWAHVDSVHFGMLQVMNRLCTDREIGPVVIRCSVAYLVHLLREAGLAGPAEGVSCSAQSDTRRSGDTATDGT